MMYQHSANELKPMLITGTVGTNRVVPDSQDPITKLDLHNTKAIITILCCL